MTRNSRKAVIVVLAAAALMPAAGAQAQWYSSVARPPAPLYPYAVPSNQPYAVQVAPNTYVIQRPANPNAQPPVRASRANKPAPVKTAAASKRRHSKIDPALIEELRNRPKIKPATVYTTQIVHEPPVVKETKRYVDDPPRVVERYHIADGETGRSPNKRAALEGGDGGPVVIKRKNASKNLGGGEKRVIDADAEITILGPDRMSIRLFRKGGANKAKAQAERTD